MLSRQPRARARTRAARTRPRTTVGGDRGWLCLALLFIGALSLRVLYLVSIGDAYFFEHLQTEPLRYHLWASAILDGPAAPGPPFEQAPGYPYFIAAVYSILGRSVTGVALVQAVLDAATCVLIAVAGRGVFGARAGLIAGTLAALYGPFIYFTGELLPSTLFIGLSVAAVAATAWPGRAPAWTVAGGFWATALLVRTEILLALPFALYDAWRRGQWPAVARMTLPPALVLVVLVGLNVAGSGKLVLLTTSGGVNLWLGNNPHADGVSPFVDGPLLPLATEVRQRAATAVEADAMFRREALAFVRTAPGQAARLAGKKLVWTVTDRELPNTSDVQWVTGHSWLFWPPLFPLSFGIILPLALAGIPIVAPRWRALTPLIGFVVTGIGTSVVLFTNARFRLIMVPALLIVAGALLDRAPQLIKAAAAAPLRPLALPTLGLLAGVILAWGNFYGVRDYRIPQIDVNTGILARNAGHLSEAERYLRQGLASNPRDALGWIHLALALEGQGKRDAARQAYLDALALNPADPRVGPMLDAFLRRHPDLPGR